MRLYPKTLLALTFLATIGLTGCATSTKIHIGQDEQKTVAPKRLTKDSPQIVHIDLFERIATIRNQKAQSSTFLLTIDSKGNETGVLKVRPQTGSLCTADILEGNPRINNSVKPADAARSQKLNMLYSGSTDEN